MAHSVCTSMSCRSESDDSFSAVDPNEPSTSGAFARPPEEYQGSHAASVVVEGTGEASSPVKLHLEDGATDGKRPTVVQMRDGTFQIQRGMIGPEISKHELVSNQRPF